MPYNRRAFTLIELLVVAIIVLLVTLLVQSPGENDVLNVRVCRSSIPRADAAGSAPIDERQLVQTKKAIFR